MSERRSKGWRRAGAALAIAGVPIAATWAVLAACNQSTTTLPYTPITGIEIPSATLVAGHGCSNDPADTNAVYRYSAVLSYVYPKSVNYPDGSLYNSPYASVFECFSDGYFENLPVDDGGDQTFSVKISAWNAANFPQELTPCMSEPDGSSPTDLCPAEQVSDVLDGGGVDPQWTTTCTAFLQPNIPGIAACGPLEPFVAGAATSDAAIADSPSTQGDASEASAQPADAAGD